MVWGEQTRGCLLLTIVEVSGICKSSCRAFFSENICEVGRGVSVRKLVTKKRDSCTPPCLTSLPPIFDLRFLQLG